MPCRLLLLLLPGRVLRGVLLLLLLKRLLVTKRHGGRVARVVPSLPLLQLTFLPKRAHYQVN